MNAACRPCRALGTCRDVSWKAPRCCQRKPWGDTFTKESGDDLRRESRRSILVSPLPCLAVSFAPSALLFWRITARREDFRSRLGSGETKRASYSENVRTRFEGVNVQIPNTIILYFG